MAHAKGWQINELHALPPTLEETFLALTEAQTLQTDTGM